jgi:hypothetical protein
MFQWPPLTEKITQSRHAANIMSANAWPSVLTTPSWDQLSGSTTGTTSPTSSTPPRIVCTILIAAACRNGDAFGPYCLGASTARRKYAEARAPVAAPSENVAGFPAM